MAEFFGIEVHTINYYLIENFSSKELSEDSVIQGEILIYQNRCSSGGGNRLLTQSTKPITPTLNGSQRAS